MSLAIQTLVNSLTSAALYILVAVGFTLVFGIMRIINFAHGAAYLAGAYGMYILGTQQGLPMPLAMLMTVIVVASVGALIEIILIERTVHDGLKTMILTLGISLVASGAVEMAFSSTPVPVPSIAEGAWRFGGVSFPKDRMVVVLAGIVVLTALWLFLRHSVWGQALRAVSQDKEMAAANGIPVRRLQALGFGGAVGLAALSGTLVASVLYSSPSIGDGALVKSFMIVIIGGVGSVPGAVLAGLLVAVVENVSTVWLGANVAGVITFAVVIIVLMVAPNGLLGKNTERI